MSLAKYRSMRDFSRTQEPRGKAARPKRLAVASEPALSFVIQKHAARRLHYDFRLELDGELLSWAVPKGPSENPADKRLAVETEPHPLEYGKFEGTIPEGEYGAGHVEIWDHGTWKPEGDPHLALRKGHLKFSLSGERLSGSWHLVRTRGVGDSKGNEKNWLLFKSTHGGAEAAPAPRKPRAVAKAPADPLPKTVEPELATLVEEAPAGDDWVHEIKLDGYRLLVRIEGGEVTLLTRNGKDWTDKFPSLRAACEELNLANGIIDGELVALDEKGISQFQALQGSLKDGQDAALVYYAFDLLHDGRDLREQPLLERKSRLREILARRSEQLGGRVRFSAHVVGQGPEFFENAGKLGLEGTIAKRGSSPYRGGRGRDWLKIKTSKRQELVVVGYTSPAGSRQHLGALLLGVHEGKRLRYAGKVGTGFSAATLRELSQRLKPLATKEPSVADPPRGAEGRNAHWVKPELVAEVVFTEMTSDGLLRHPRFIGLREDKPAREVKLETPAPAEPVAKGGSKPTAAAKRASGVAKRASGVAKRASGAAKRAPASKSSTSYPISNPTKVLYPEDGITKSELLDYYELVAERMLPHVRNRPLTLVRCPNGYDKQRFFQKHPGAGQVDGLRSVSIREKEGKAPYSVLDDESGLFALVQLAALEIHTWGSRADDFERPDTLVFDLDPDPEVEYSAVIEAAHTVRRVFDSAKLESFVKTTGGKGLHVCIPILPKLEWDAIKDFTGRVALALAQHSPELYVATQSKAKRRGKIFIDYLRNARSATFIAPYSTRARAGAPVAVPLEWDELSPKLLPSHFTIRNIEQRLAKLRSDPFARLVEVQQSLEPQGVNP